MKTCAECGYPNDFSEHRCEKCGIRFEETVLEPVVTSSRRPRAATAENPLDFHVQSGSRTSAAVAVAVAALAPPWRGEVTQRVSRFQKRHGLQRALEFEAPVSAPAPPVGNVIRFPSPDSEVEDAPAEPEPTPVASWGPPSPAPAPTPRATVAAPQQQAIDFPRMKPLDQPAMLDFPVAPVAARAHAALLDGAAIAAGCTLMLGVFYAMGVRVPFDASARALLPPIVFAVALLPVLYLYLFLTYAKATPGMSALGLRIVDFDGRPATARQRRTRILASLASMASILMGFLWAAVDDERLTWHDRISETCLTFRK